MPSTVKVRVKAARNLPLPERGNTVVSRGSGSGGGAGGGGNSSNIGNSLLHSPILQPPQSRDPYVVVSLGGHAAAIASALEDPSSMGKSSGSTSKADIIAASRPGYEARTKVCRRTTMPVWDEEFRFDCSDDTLLQDEPLIFKVFDSCDTSAIPNSPADENIGLCQVYVDLNPLLTNQSDDTDSGGCIGD
jgi:C2 domain